ncbi:MAG TPA: dihydrolipoyllysine-residue acetyltransferase [Candidatus Sulfotelmatobacter sp.]|jgi:pyruvate dehydrogenase E2 component (dihydrolipoamide acetyltransferase)|nr:dihydrolipoyllysine-residue acetyltransferase [Candidatus Sulfotelmatobacter sp.]
MLQAETLQATSLRDIKNAPSGDATRFLQEEPYAVIEFKLPELGENIEQGDLVRLMVAPGAAVSAGQSVMELETDKAVVEVPSSVSGTVQEIRVKEGDKIKVGQVIFTVDGAEAKASTAPNQPAAPAVAPPPKEKPTATATSKEVAAPSPPAAPSAPSSTPGASEFKLPELGENISQGDLVRLMVAPGTKVSEGQPVMELETDKAVVEVPSSVSGVVKEVKVKEGEKIKVGQVIFTLEGGAPAAQPARPRSAPVEHVSGQHGARLAFQAAIRAEGKTEEQALPPDQPHQTVPSFSMPAQLGKVAGTEQRQPVPAAPHVRRLAREVGIDIYEVKGTGPGGRISEDDVKAHAKVLLSAAATAAATPRAGHFAQPHLPDFAKWGKVERVSMRGVRRKTAEHLAEAWNTIPHVTQHDRADITELEHLRARFAPKAEEAGGKMTVTAIALKVCAAALKVFPQFNASIDIEKEEIVYKQYINIGVAADTDRGLLVPVIRDVEKKNIVELAVELSGLSKKARDKKLTPGDMEGGTFTITNLGGIGGVGFTPIVNFPEVAILGLSRSRMEPEWINGKFEPRLILPLSLSYDHRLIDGADAARFLRWISEAFEQPFLLSVQG